jgi:hypothetical protein
MHEGGYAFLHAALIALSYHDLKGFLHQQPQSSFACLVKHVS